MKNISLTEKLILCFLFLGISAIVIVSIYSFYSVRQALSNQTIDYATTLRLMKTQRIELLLSIFLSLTCFGFVFIFTRRITRTMRQLKDAVIKVGKGEYNVKLPIGTSDEIGALKEAFNIMTLQILGKTRELQHERIGWIRSVIDGEESERQRLSRELHDSIGQSMVALKLQLESLLYIDEQQIKENINILKDQFDGTIDEIRRISNNLMPSRPGGFWNRYCHAEFMP